MTLDRATIDGKVSEIREKFLGTILTLHQFEEFGSIVDKLCLLISKYAEHKLQFKLTVVHVLPPINTSCVNSRNKKGILV